MKKFVKKFLTIVVLISYVLLQFPVTLLAQGNDTLNDGDIVGTNPVTSTKDANGVELKKTISKTNNSNEYEVTLELKGKDQVVSQQSTAPIYAVVVFDTSNSMNCNKYSSDYLGGKYCSESNPEKYTAAKNGARSFARALLNNYPSSQIALVTFSKYGVLRRNFANENLDDVFFGDVDGGTNLHSGLIRANELLTNKKIPSNAKKYVVIISDGEPTYYSLYANYQNSGGGVYEVALGDGKRTTDEVYNNTLSMSNSIKKYAEIFSIGYQLPSGKVYKDLTAADILRNIASSDKPNSYAHYYNANPAMVATAFSDIVDSVLVNVPAGTNAVITDTIGDGFEFVDGTSGNKKTFNVGEITEEGKTVSFKIRLKDNLVPGEYETNNTSDNGVNVSYTAYNGAGVIDSINESAKAYHNPDLSYTVKYYKDSVSDSNFITEETGTGKMDDPITVNKNLNVKGYVCNDNKQYTINKNDQIVTIIYTRKNTLSYIVQYFKELVNGEEKISDDDDNTFTGKTYQDVVTKDQILNNKYYSNLPIFGYKKGIIKTDMPYTIDDGENIIKVCYERRTDLSYTVKYVDKDSGRLLSSKVVPDVKYNETYKETAIEAPEGYVLDDDETKTITLDKEVNELVFTYKVIKVIYTINEYYDDELTNTYDKEVKYGEELTFEEKDGYTLEVEYLDDNVINLYYTSIKTETYEVPPKTNVNNTYYLYLLLSLIIVGLVKVKKLD